MSFRRTHSDRLTGPHEKSVLVDAAPTSGASAAQKQDALSLASNGRVTPSAVEQDSSLVYIVFVGNTTVAIFDIPRPIPTTPLPVESVAAILILHTKLVKDSLPKSDDENLSHHHHSSNNS